ncbi:MAG: Uma2 family endonuclease [Hyphomicrobiaceae bacterium]
MSGFSEDKSPAYEPRPSGGYVDKATFCRWVERQERKYEWKEGRIVQMTNVSWAHSNIVTNFIMALGECLDRDNWSIMAVDFGVETDDAIRYPDIVVEAMNSDDPKRRRSEAPIVMVEVLSPSSGARDFVEKLAEYQTFTTLEAYVVASQDEPICWLWQRREDGTWPSVPDEIAGRNAAIGLRARGVELPMAEIYRGIATT